MLSLLRVMHVTHSEPAQKVYSEFFQAAANLLLHTVLSYCRVWQVTKVLSAEGTPSFSQSQSLARLKYDA